MPYLDTQSPVLGLGVNPTWDPRGLASYIQQRAQAYGIDPNIALRVARSEGLSNPIGDQGKSFGAFQLFTGGGMGNDYQRATGLDPSDPANERSTIDFALQQASQHGWSPFHGARHVGIGNWQGITIGPGMTVGGPTDFATNPENRPGVISQQPAQRSFGGTPAFGTTSQQVTPQNSWQQPSIPIQSAQGSPYSTPTQAMNNSMPLDPAQQQSTQSGDSRPGYFNTPLDSNLPPITGPRRPRIDPRLLANLRLPRGFRSPLIGS